MSEHVSEVSVRRRLREAIDEWRRRHAPSTDRETSELLLDTVVSAVGDEPVLAHYDKLRSIAERAVEALEERRDTERQIRELSDELSDLDNEARSLRKDLKEVA